MGSREGQWITPTAFSSTRKKTSPFFRKIRPEDKSAENSSLVFSVDQNFIDRLKEILADGGNEDQIFLVEISGDLETVFPDPDMKSCFGIQQLELRYSDLLSERMSLEDLHSKLNHHLKFKQHFAKFWYTKTDIRQRYQILEEA